MKMLLTLFILLTSQLSWANAEPTLVIGPASPAQFNYRETPEGDKITILKPHRAKPQVIEYKTTTLIQTHRMHIEMNNSRKQKKSIDLLVVFSSVDASSQMVEVFIPVRNEDFIISKQINPVCALPHWGGGLYTENPQTDLANMFKVEEKGGRVVLSANVRKNEQSERQMTSCFEIMLNARSR